MSVSVTSSISALVEPIPGHGVPHRPLIVVAEHVLCTRLRELLLLVAALLKLGPFRWSAVLEVGVVTFCRLLLAPLLRFLPAEVLGLVLRPRRPAALPGRRLRAQRVLGLQPGAVRGRVPVLVLLLVVVRVVLVLARRLGVWVGLLGLPGIGGHHARRRVLLERVWHGY